MVEHVCPDACKIQLLTIEKRLDNHRDKLVLHTKDIKHAHEKCLLRIESDYKHWEKEVNQRSKTSTIIAVTVIVIGVLSGLLSGLWVQSNGMEKKVDMIRENQVRVMAILEIHTNNEKSSVSSMFEKSRESKDSGR